MPSGLRRFQESGHSHFVTFSCRHRQPYFSTAKLFDLFVQCLEDTRVRFDLRVFGYVVMPEHVHLLLSEPAGFAQVSAQSTSANLGHRHSSCSYSSSWEKRYYDRNVRDYREFTVKLRYLHRNPVKRGLVRTPEEWKWSSYRHYALREIAVVEIESEWTARDRERGGGDEKAVFLAPR
ncbi:MAG: transposase [Terriglobales bacterium]